MVLAKLGFYPSFVFSNLNNKGFSFWMNGFSNKNYINTGQAFRQASVATFLVVKLNTARAVE